jgi:polysaccharide export outer membrane protein
LQYRAAVVSLAFALSPVFAQAPKSDLDKAPKPVEPAGSVKSGGPGGQDGSKQTRRRQAGETTPSNATPSADSPASNAGKVDADRPALRREDESEAEASVVAYVNNFFSTTRLGPEDVVTVDVFDQPNYSRANITVPPNGRVNYPVIGQVMVAGRTLEEIEKEITDRLAEYIREPKVTVQLVQVHSMKYMVLGDVTTPGIYEMTRRMTVNEALAKAGDVNRYGDMKNINVLRMQPDGQAKPLPVNIQEIRRGKAQDIFLIPGDTIVVPGNKFKTIDKVMSVATLGYWMRVIVR